MPVNPGTATHHVLSFAELCRATPWVRALGDKPSSGLAPGRWSFPWSLAASGFETMGSRVRDTMSKPR